MNFYNLLGAYFFILVMVYSLDNVKCKYPDIISSGTLDRIIDVLNKLNDKEKELNILNTEKINLELEIEKLRTIVNNFKPLIEIITVKDTSTTNKEEKFNSRQPLAFGIVSPGEGNTRIG